MTDLSDLIKRVEEAKGPDRQLDHVIWLTLYAPTHWGGSRIIGSFTSGSDEIGFNTEDGYRHLRAVCPAQYTASLDAALALVEKKLPGCRWTKNIEGEIWLWHGDWSTSSHRCANDALTCLFALLHALHSQSDSERSPPLKDGG